MTSGEGDSEITLGVLNAVEENSRVTQRDVAKYIGIALGLTNAYLKRCIRKGLIKVQQVPANRYSYYLTPKGFAEKSRLTGEYLAQGFQFFHIHIENLFAHGSERTSERLLYIESFQSKIIFKETFIQFNFRIFS